MKNLSRILSCLLTGILCAVLLAGCFGSSTDSEDDASDNGDVETVAEEDAGAEDEDVTTSADYSTLTISTYSVDDAGSQTLSSTLSYDHDGNLLEEYYVYDIDTTNDVEIFETLEYKVTYSYDEDSLLSDYLYYKVYLSSGEKSVEEYTVYFNYEKDENGKVTSISAEEINPDNGETVVYYALLSYNTEGNVSSVYFNDDIGYMEDMTLDFSYSFDVINGYSISYDSDEAVRVIEYDENGMISGIAYGDVFEFYIPDFLGYSIFKYIDSIQDSGLAYYCGFLLAHYSNDFYEIEYDSQGNIISRKLYDCAEYYEEEDLLYSYTFEYEYNEYGLISTRYIYVDGEADSISYYEYE